MKPIISWILRILAAVILAQTLYFKFSGHPDSVAIFSALGLEPAGRIGIGVLELIAVILLIMRCTVVYGALLAWGLMVGAIFSHLTQIGIEGGLLELFLLAVTVWLSASILLVIHRTQLPIIGRKFGNNGELT